MDITNLLPQAQDLEVHLPTGAPTGVVLQVTSTDNRRFFDLARKCIIEDAEGTKDTKDIEAGLLRRAQQVAACIVGWSGITSNGEPVAYSHEKAVELLSNPGASYICEQVEGYVTKRTNFFRADSKAA